MSDTQTTLLLRDVLAQYLQARTFRSKRTNAAYARSIRFFERTLGHDASAADLTPLAFAGLQAALMRSNISTLTCRERSGHILLLWRWLARRGLAEPVPAILWPLKSMATLAALDHSSPEVTRKAYVELMLEDLLARCGKLAGSVEGIEAAAFFRAFILTRFNTAEPGSALLDLCWRDMDLDRGCLLSPRTGAELCIEPATVAALRAITAPRREKVFPWDGGEESLLREFRDLSTAASAAATKGGAR
jgi:integrase